MGQRERLEVWVEASAESCAVSAEEKTPAWPDRSDQVQRDESTTVQELNSWQEQKNQE